MKLVLMSLVMLGSVAFANEPTTETTAPMPAAGHEQVATAGEHKDCSKMKNHKEKKACEASMKKEKK